MHFVFIIKSRCGCVFLSLSKFENFHVFVIINVDTRPGHSCRVSNGDALYVMVTSSNRYTVLIIHTETLDEDAVEDGLSASCAIPKNLFFLSVRALECWF